MVLTENEKKYLAEFEKKNYRPELLFVDPDIIERLQNHPMALWKCRCLNSSTLSANAGGVF